jgi:hypothetical protein
MGSQVPGSLSAFVDRSSAAEKTLVLLNHTGPKPLWELLGRAFGDQPIDLVERQVPGGVTDRVVLVEDGREVASSPMDRLQETFLLVNADRYRTSVGGLTEATVPDVLTALHDVEFTLKGYPASSKEKLLLVIISRFIEIRALGAGDGELRSSFQYLSRLDCEYGTRTVYESLGETGTDVHVYGVRDGDDLAVDELDATVHVGDDEEYRRSWFVVFTPPEGADGHVALVAIRVGDNVWRATWTYEPERVHRIGRYVDRRL